MSVVGHFSKIPLKWPKIIDLIIISCLYKLVYIIKIFVAFINYLLICRLGMIPNVFCIYIVLLGKRYRIVYAVEVHLTFIE